MIAHIKNYYDYCLSPNCPFIPEWKKQGEDYYREKMESLRFGREQFIPYLEQHTELTKEDETLLAEIMATESEWFRVPEEAEQSEDTPRFTVEQTSDAFDEPFIIRDNNVVSDTQDGRYYDIDGIYQTFNSEEEAQAVADTLNSAEAPAPAMEQTDDLIGKEITLDNRRYVIESVGKISGDVSMRDITFQNEAGFPINRVEKLPRVREWLKAQEQAESLPEKEKAPAVTSDRSNYRITEDTLGIGGAKEKFKANGVYYGQNVISKNMIIANRRHLLNGNSFILGVSGAGKSFTAKEEMTNIILTDPNADVIIIDPEREYSPLVKAMQGEVIHISATSENHINAMDMNSDYGDGANPVILKSEFILSLCEQLIGGSTLGAKQKSIIDRCTASVYRHYQQGNYMGVPPTLQDFREELLKQNEPEAQEIALAIELFTDGSLNTFAKHTNVDTHSRLICYDILDLGKQLQPIGMLVVLDSILNRITQNRAKGRNTFIFIDEIYLLFQYEYSANFLFTLWKRVRKYGAYRTGITQNVDDLLQSHTARTMLANSEFIIMLNQASTDRLELAKLLNISDLQMSYITNVGAGQGLLKVGSSLVPFVNKFPRNTELYRLMTTKFGEV